MQEFPLHMQNFLTYLETIRGKSSLTVDEYALDLRMFFRFLKRERGLVSPSLPFEQIPIDDVDEAPNSNTSPTISTNWTAIPPTCWRCPKTPPACQSTYRLRSRQGF